MRILLAPNAFKNCLNERQVASILDKAIRGFDARIDVVQCPIADDVEGGGDVASLAAFDAALRQGADLVITGEGRLDERTALRKGASEVIVRAHTAGIPCLAICGSLADDLSALHALGLTRAYPLSPVPMPVEESIRKASPLLGTVIRQIISERLHLTTAFTVPATEPPRRIDIFLAEASGLSRSRIQTLIWEGCVTCNGVAVAGPARKTVPGATYDVMVQPSAPVEALPQDIPLDILFEDEHLLVLNKSAGIVVHPSAGHVEGTLVNALLHHCGEIANVGEEARPGLVHRLDRDTTGVIVVAKTAEMLEKLASQFQAGTVRKVYLALVHGIPERASGRIETGIGRDPRHRQRMAVLLDGGRHAITNYRVLERFPEFNISLLEVQIETGRTHQIRVHSRYLGHPVLFDPVYGARHRDKAFVEALIGEGGQDGRTEGCKGANVQKFLPECLEPLPPLYGRANLPAGQLLHARTLAFTHPVTGEAHEISAPLPERFMAFLETCRG